MRPDLDFFTVPVTISVFTNMSLIKEGTRMEPEKIKIPAEAVELYSRYIHGEISRRDFFEKVSRFAVVGLSAAAIVERLMPNYALGQQVRKDDERIKTSYETIESPKGNGYIRGYFVRPFSQDTRAATPTKLPAVLVVHENRGLNRVCSGRADDSWRLSER